MNLKQINVAKKILLLYWTSVIITLILFMNTTFGYYHVLIGGVVLLAHVGETFLFNRTLQKYSDNVTRDTFFILIYGIIVPTELKLKKQTKKP